MRKYRTVQGDTWDLIAYRHYPKQGRELAVSTLIQANTQYISTVIFPAGCIIELPDIPAKKAGGLPPWMQ